MFSKWHVSLNIHLGLEVSSLIAVYAVWHTIQFNSVYSHFCENIYIMNIVRKEYNNKEEERKKRKINYTIPTNPYLL